VKPDFQEYLKPKVFTKLVKAAEMYGRPAYIVGGYVRDIILERPSQDIDVVVVGSGLKLAGIFAELAGPESHASYFRNFGTAQVRYRDEEREWIIEFVGARKESYRKDSRKPVVENGTMQDDLNRRDFTINALAVSIYGDDFGTLTDAFGGISDIQNRVIRTPLEPGRTYSDDPLRMIRAVRFANQLDFLIEPESFKAISRNAGRIKIVSKERINDELEKIMMTDTPSVGFKLLDKAGILVIIFPEFTELKGAEFIEGKGHKDNFYHTLKVLDNVAARSDNLWLRWAAVFHDIAKPVTKKFEPDVGWTFHAHEFVGAKMVPRIFRKMKMPLNEHMKYVQKMVLLHLRPIVLAQDVVTDSAVRRLLFEAGDDIDDLMTLCEADITSKNPAKVRRYLKNFELVREKLVEVEEKDRIRNWQPPVSGNEIMEVFGIPESREVGVIKTAIKEAILDGIIKNDHDEAYKFMLDEGRKMGLKPVRNLD
jgi:poly(A) polymerase